MPQPIVSEIIPNQALAVGTTYPFDLGVNGISYLWFQIAALQTAANTLVSPDNLLAAIDTLSVTYNGQAIWSGRAQELARLGQILTGVMPWFTAADNGNNADVAISFVVPFGRKLLDPNEGMMNVLRGQLQLLLTTPAAFTNITTPKVTAQQVELQGNSFKRVNKATSRQTTPSATGNLDVPMPIGNVLRGVLVQATTRYRDLNTVGGIQSAILRVNNVEQWWTGGQIGHAMHLALARGRDAAGLWQGARLENLAAAYTQNVDTAQGNTNTLEWFRQYAYLDLDPTQDDAYSVDSKGLSQFDLRLNFAIAETSRIVPYESVLLTNLRGTP